MSCGDDFQSHIYILDVQVLVLKYWVKAKLIRIKQYQMKL